MRPSSAQTLRSGSPSAPGLGRCSTIGAAIIALIAGLLVAISPSPALASDELVVGPTASAGTDLFEQSFADATLNPASPVTKPAVPVGKVNQVCLTASDDTTQTPIPGCQDPALDAEGDGVLRLTDNGYNKVGGLIAAESSPSISGLDFAFDGYQWGGRLRGDGYSFVVGAVNPETQVPEALTGGTGGSLGYIGYKNGYLGVAFDTYGNFARSKCADDPAWARFVPNNVTVRGPDMCIVTSTIDPAYAGEAPSLSGTTRANSGVPVQVTVNPSAAEIENAGGLMVPALSLLVAFTPIGGTQQTLVAPLPNAEGIFDSSWLNSDGIPRQLSFGWVASSGGATDYHEISTASTESISPVSTLETTQLYSGATGDSGTGTFVVTPTVRGIDLNAPVTVNGTVPPGMRITDIVADGWDCDVTGATTYSCVSDGVSFPVDTTLPSINVNVTIEEPTSEADIAEGTTSRTLSPDAQSTLATDVSVGLQVDGISPAAGPLAGGEVLTITGGTLTDSTVTIGGNPCTILDINLAGTSLTCTVPPGDAGAADVVVTTPDSEVTRSQAYTYLPTPTMGEISPAEGSPGGGDELTVNGTDLDNATVTVGGNPCTDVVVNAERTSLTCTTPPGLVGPADVVVETAGGTTEGTDAYTYLNVPAVTGMDPASGPLVGGETVTITGTNLTDATVTIGDAECVVSSSQDDSVECVVPAGVAGNATVVVSKGDGTDTVPGGYTYIAPPTVDVVTPNEGPTVGGEEITISGAELENATVTIDGQPCTSVEVAEDGDSLTCTTPPGTRGNVTVEVTTPGGTVEVPGGYSYLDIPIVTGIDPTSGPTDGAYSVTISGENLTDATVTFGGLPCTDPTVNLAGTSLTCDIPAHAEGDVEVLVSKDDGDAEVPGTFFYSPAPFVTGISPESGSIGGGDTLTIEGVNLFNSTVTVGGNACDDVAIAEDNRSLTCTVPAGTAGLVDVVVTTPSGDDTSADPYLYENTAVVDEITPDEGSTSGGETVTINGRNLDDAVVTIGGNECTDVDVSDDGTSLTCEAPGGVAGSADVVVTKGDGPTTVVDGYTFVAEPAADSMGPLTGPISGGQTATIHGSNLDGAYVTIAGGECTDVIVASDGNSLTCVTPPGFVGYADVDIVTAGGITTVPESYEYLDIAVVDEMSPAEGPVGGDTEITLTGLNLTGAEVTVGGDACLNISVNDAGTELTCDVPAHSRGEVEVVVTKPGGEVTVPGGFSYYDAPTITRVTPNSGLPEGGGQIRINGRDFIDPTVLIGDQECTDIEVAEDGTSLTCTVPEGSAGLTDITVENEAGETIESDGYRYAEPPTIDSVSPTSGPSAGGETVTIRGTNLFGVEVTVGGDTISDVTVSEDGTTATFVVPRLPAGRADIVVTTNSGSATLAGAFEVVATPTPTPTPTPKPKPKPITIKAKKPKGAGYLATVKLKGKTKTKKAKTIRIYVSSKSGKPAKLVTSVKSKKGKWKSVKTPLAGATSAVFCAQVGRKTSTGVLVTVGKKGKQRLLVVDPSEWATVRGDVVTCTLPSSAAATP